ncbi:putative F-box protein At3g16210 [Bidens hawaiensis]|uniref:putative F-box protein At3g16210 n=1 Tax=Bidens hawaiensis TaxID=980011 RepID=UPI004049ACF2
MANTHHIADDVLHNILARLPGKPLLRFRCVSKHWNGLISDPYFMKSRSRRMILLQFTRPLVAIDVNEAHHAVELPHSPLEHEEENTQVSIVGTLNGIVLLALIHNCKSLLIPSRFKLVLYNPLTCASRIVALMGRALVHDHHPYVFGFGYGATKDDIKIVRFEYFSNHPNGPQYKFDVFDLKTCSWSTQPRDLTIESFLQSAPGTFLKGFLYWLTLSSSFGILALNVNEMVFLNVKLPDELTYVNETLLGSIGGCLCVANKVGSTRLDVVDERRVVMDEGTFIHIPFGKTLFLPHLYFG